MYFRDDSQAASENEVLQVTVEQPFQFASESWLPFRGFPKRDLKPSVAEMDNSVKVNSVEIIDGIWAALFG